jgi:hypothetical protein
VSEIVAWTDRAGKPTHKADVATRRDERWPSNNAAVPRQETETCSLRFAFVVLADRSSKAV